MSQRFLGNAVPGDIIKVLAYHPRDLDICGISSRTNRPIVESPRVGEPESLGCLDKLPIELLDIVLQHIDLHAVAMMRLVNRQARAVMDSSSPYKHIVLHAPGAVAALARTNVASHFTIKQVFSVLSTPSCNVCGNFGTFLWIPECMRCCITCLRFRAELMPMGEKDARIAFGLTKKTMKIPTITTFPGEYSAFQRPYRKKRYLVSRRTARQVAISIHGGEEGLATYLSGSSRATNTHNDNIPDHITRFMVVVALPYFDPSSRKCHAGLACHGCQEIFMQLLHSNGEYQLLLDSIERRDRTYTEEGILQHFAECSGARALWTRYQQSEATLLSTGQ